MSKIWLALLTMASVASADTFKVDDGHTSIIFKINHLGFSNVYGTIGGAEGTLNWDTANPSKSSFEVTAKVATISTRNEKRDEHLKKPDFFDVKQFPDIKIKSKSIKKVSEGKYEVNGDLTMHGVTKPISFTFVQNKTGQDPWGKTRTGGDASLTVKRSDFGMNFMNKPGEIGNDVELMISLEAVKQ